MRRRAQIYHLKVKNHPVIILTALPEMKSAKELADALIKKQHPYAVPEITTLGQDGNMAMHPDYWEWLSAYVKTTG